MKNELPHSTRDLSVEAVNDRLAREFPIDAYYASAPWPIRIVEGRRLAIIRRMVGDWRGLQVLEIGSGGGHVLRMFAGAHLTALDVSGVFLEQARQNLAGFDACFIKGEVDKLDLPMASYDRIICTEVLEHTRDPEAIVARIAALLRPDGVAVITIPNDALILRVKAILRRTPVGIALRHRINWGGDQHHIHQWRAEEFRVLLERHLRVREQRAAPLNAFPLRLCYRCEKG